MYNIFMDNYVQIASQTYPIDEGMIEFGDVELMRLLAECKTYDEFLVQCDLNNIECIISRAEFENMRKPYFYNDISLAKL